MYSAAQAIEDKVQSFDRGRVFFADDFLDIASNDVIRQTLVRLTKSGLIIRVAQGIYCYPEIDEKFGLGAIPPTYESIAYAMAKRSGARIVPTGEYSMNLLGLSTQIPMNFVFLTDGPSRSIDIGEGQKITFKRTAPKNVAFTNKLAMLITSALKAVKQENITEEQLSIVKNLLQKEEKSAVLADLRLMPNWIRKIIIEAYE